MRKIFALLFVSGLTLSFIACTTDDDQDIIKDITNTETYNGTYELFINDSLISDGAIDEVGMTQWTDHPYKNIVSLDRGTILQLLISGFSYTVGEQTTLNDDSDDEPTITFGGWDILYKDREEFYFSTGGTLTRTSDSRITFEGTCSEMLNSNDIVSFRGYYESEAFKEIK